MVYLFHRILKTSHISTTHNCLQVYEFLPVNYSFMLSVDLQKMLGGYSSLSVPSVQCNLHMDRFNYFNLVLTQRLCHILAVLESVCLACNLHTCKLCPLYG